MNRRNAPPFDPKAIIVKLQELEKLQQQHYEGYVIRHDRADLVRQYLEVMSIVSPPSSFFSFPTSSFSHLFFFYQAVFEGTVSLISATFAVTDVHIFRLCAAVQFKQLMLKIDPDGDEEDEDGNPASTPVKNQSGGGQQPVHDAVAMRQLFATPSQASGNHRPPHATPATSSHGPVVDLGLPPAPHIIRPGFNPSGVPMVPLQRLQQTFGDVMGPPGVPPLTIRMPGATPMKTVSCRLN